MGLRGGYNILLEGRPGRSIKVMPEPDELFLPLQSNRFNFSDLCVNNGQRVTPGDILAKDPANHAVPLLAPRAGNVNLEKAQGHIVLEEIAKLGEHADLDEEELEHISKEMGAAGMKRYKLLSLGAWEFFYDAYTGNLPDPLSTPQAVIVSTLSLEPYVARGDAQLANRLLQFTRGLEHLQSLLEYQPIYLVMPDIKSDFAAKVREQIRGYAWAKLIEVPLTYPYDNFNILARHLGLKKDIGPIWGVRTEGVLAVDRALTFTKPCMVRILTVGGPGAKEPTHISVMPGYPVKKILKNVGIEDDTRIINGGLMTGQALAEGALGLDTECRGLTVVPELKEREMLGFARPGGDRASYSKCFLSSLKGKFTERLTTGVRGEGRPCVACNYCEEICPAGIMPHLIHKYIYSDLIEEADAARVDLCVRCGLCSYVCPSKIELRQQFIEVSEEIEKEKEEARQEALKQEALKKEQESVEEKSE
jgi:Na+-transporting NADH:ubiquinone oxidoreductase subunit A